jgi:hypothetical protein
MTDNLEQPFYDNDEYTYSRLKGKQQILTHTVKTSGEIFFIAPTGCVLIDIRALGNGNITIDQLGTATDIILPATPMLLLTVLNPDLEVNFLEPNDLLRIVAPPDTLLTYTISY